MQLSEIRRLVQPVETADGAAQIATQEDFLAWLSTQYQAQRVPLYISAGDRWSLFVHAVLVPVKNLQRPWKGLTEWSGNPFDSASCGLVVYGGGKGPRLEMNRPWQEGQPRVLMGAQQLLFSRSFEGRIGEKDYIELAQDLTHAHGLHWLEERQSWCRLNDEGDVVDLAGIVREKGNGQDRANVVWVDRDLLDQHMAATTSCLAVMFDSTRVPRDFIGFSNAGYREVTDRQQSLVYKFSIEGSSSYFRGVKFVQASGTAEALGKVQYDSAQQPKKYETFIIQDWKNRRIIEWSCDPAALASYYEPESKNPLQMSPVFFKPSVLDKYKVDRQKYQLTDRSISCRNAWHLETFDVNEAGQVHTYITYLGRLPIEEQRYWKSCNEQPKGPISKRSMQTDFEGTWDTHPDPLRDLRDVLIELTLKPPAWFRMKQAELVEQIHYPLTAAFGPWDAVIVDLAKTTVEGLEKAPIVAIAKKNGGLGDPGWGSIKWLRFTLVTVGVESDRVEELVAPFEEVQFLRTKLGAHASGAEAAKIRQQLLRDHTTPRAHIEALASRLHSSLRSLLELNLEP